MALPGLVCAQDLQSARFMMDGALAELASHSRLTLVMNGTELDGPKRHEFSVVLALGFSTHNGRDFAQIELLDYVDNRLKTRIAGDGERFWSYDVTGKVYSSTEYGTAAHVGKERERLFQNLLRRLQGDQTFLARLVKDAFSGQLNTGSAWMPWRPSANVSIDPVGNVVCTSVSPVPSSLKYVLARTPGFGYALDSVTYHEETVVSNRRRVTDWTVSIYRDHLPQGTSWQFVPPVGSRAVSVSIGG